MYIYIDYIYIYDIFIYNPYIYIIYIYILYYIIYISIHDYCTTHLKCFNITKLKCFLDPIKFINQITFIFDFQFKSHIDEFKSSASRVGMQVDMQLCKETGRSILTYVKTTTRNQNW